METDAAALLTALRGQRLTLVTAESLTGGGLGALLTAVPGASDVYLGGIVAYSTRLKQVLLGVPTELVAEHGVVSAECAEAMARGARERLGAHLAVSTTGVAGPETQEGRPVGLVYLGLSGAALTTSLRVRLSGDREEVRGRACAAALSQVRAAWRDAAGTERTGSR